MGLIDLGEISLIINTVAIILVGIGVFGRNKSDRVMMWHGYLAILGFVLKMATVTFVMAPTIVTEPLNMDALSPLGYWIVLAKIAVGILGTVMSFICIIPWFFKPLKEMACSRVWRLMMPTTIVWILAVLLGAFVHFGNFV